VIRQTELSFAFDLCPLRRAITLTLLHIKKAVWPRFTQENSRRPPIVAKGPIRVDAKYPWHFVWEGTGEHYFFNGTTAFWLMGWRDERVITNAIDRLRNMKINRLPRVALGRGEHLLGRTSHDRGKLYDDASTVGRRSAEEF
jgi:hypothetical protein